MWEICIQTNNENVKRQPQNERHHSNNFSRRTWPVVFVVYAVWYLDTFLWTCSIAVISKYHHIFSIMSFHRLSISFVNFMCPICKYLVYMINIYIYLFILPNHHHHHTIYIYICVCISDMFECRRGKMSIVLMKCECMSLCVCRLKYG